MITNLEALVAACKAGEKPFQELVDLVPYARFMGLQVEMRGEEMAFILPRNEMVLGNPTLPALHGGAIAGFMEQSAAIFVLSAMGEPKIPKTIDFTIDYLRAGLFKDVFAECRVTRLGRRIANVAIEAWQDSRDQPIAIARCHFLISDSASQNSGL